MTINITVLCGKLRCVIWQTYIVVSRKTLPLSSGQKRKPSPTLPLDQFQYIAFRPIYFRVETWPLGLIFRFSDSPDVIPPAGHSEQFSNLSYNKTVLQWPPFFRSPYLIYLFLISIQAALLPISTPLFPHAQPTLLFSSRRQHVPPKHRYTPTRLHDIKSLKTVSCVSQA